MKAIPAERVRMGGEVYARALKNFSRLHDLPYRPGHAGRAPFDSADWPGDWEGRTLLALALHAGTLHARPAFLDALAEDVRSRCNAHGYRGEVVDPEAINEQVYPSHSWLLRGLIEFYRLTGRKDILDWINALLDNLFLPMLPHLEHYPVTRAQRGEREGGGASGSLRSRYREWLLSSDVGCVLIPVDGLSAAYELTGRKELLPLIDRCVALFRAGDAPDMKLQTHASLTFARGALRMARLTGDRSLVETAQKLFANYKRFGMTAAWANFNWFRTPSWTEPCAVIDSFMVAHQLWELTNDPAYLDDAQMIFYNGFFRGQRPNGGFGCDSTGENGFLRAVPGSYEAFWCCTMRGGEGLGAPSRTAAYPDGGAIVLPWHLTMELDLGCAVLREETDYPAEGRTRWHVVSGDGSMRTLKLFVPARAERPRLFADGRELPAEMENGFVSARLSLRPGAEVELRFDLPLRFEGVLSEVYGDRPGAVIVHGTQILAAENAPEEIDLSKMERTPDGWRCGEALFKPIADGYLEEKEALLRENLRLRFR